MTDTQKPRNTLGPTHDRIEAAGQAMRNAGIEPQCATVSGATFLGLMAERGLTHAVPMAIVIYVDATGPGFEIRPWERVYLPEHGGDMPHHRNTERSDPR